jgi:4-hydroxy-tetrahydrodipicolinate reductase
MGRTIEAIALARGHKIASIIDEDTAITTIDSSTDVAIEFTQPDSAYKNIAFCIENNFPVISGTTGWLENYDKVINLCKIKNGTFLYASNFSIGVNIFFELNQWMAKRMKNLDFSISLSETHHTEKKDAPSGTAISLVEAILQQHPEKEGWINQESTDNKNIGIVSQRIPNVVGEHTVNYSSNLETISFQHKAHDRKVFAEGAVKVAEWISDKKGVYTMSDFINHQ